MVIAVDKYSEIKRNHRLIVAIYGGLLLKLTKMPSYPNFRALKHF
jgi:hypothetical protein